MAEVVDNIIKRSATRCLADAVAPLSLNGQWPQDMLRPRKELQEGISFASSDGLGLFPHRSPNSPLILMHVISTSQTGRVFHGSFHPQLLIDAAKEAAFSRPTGIAQEGVKQLLA